MSWRPDLRVTHLPAATAELRSQVRAFLSEQRADGRFEPACDSWLSGIDPAFSAELGRRGWLGLTIPVELGGHGLGALDRFVVTEELLVAGAPVAAHWCADRQVAPSLVRFGTPEQQRRFLPDVVSGRCYFALGMSEPDAGSDLAAVRTRAEPVPGGWRINGTKLWTSGAHVAHALVVLARTGPAEPTRHAGLSQLIVELPHEGVTIRPIASLDGGHHFNEVVFEDAVVGEEALLGQPGAGWEQVTTELAHERSGPERVLSTLPLLIAWADRLASEVGTPPDPVTVRALGRLVARLVVLRQLSLAVAGSLAGGGAVSVEAALVKDLGTRFERDVVEVVRCHAGIAPDPGAADPFERLLAGAVLHTPAFSLRGGTTEILRSVVARSFDVR